MSNLAPEFFTTADGRLTHEARLYLLSLTGGASAAAPAPGSYITAVAEAALPNSRQLVDSVSAKVQLGTAGRVSIERAALTGDATAAQNSNALVLANTAVTPGTYGDSTHVGQFTVDAKGRLTAAANVLIAGQTLLKAPLTLTDAQIKKLPSTPVAILAAPASGFRNKLIGGSVRAHIVTGYAGLDPSFCALIPAGLVSGDWVTTVIANDVTTSPALAHLTALITVNGTDGVVDLIPYQEVGMGTLPYTGYVKVYPEGVGAWDAQAWSVSLDNNGSTADLTGGNAANTILITLYYVLESLS